MLHFAIGLFVGIVATAIVAIVYHAKIVADYKFAASTAGLLFNKVEGKITAIRKAL